MIYSITTYKTKNTHPKINLTQSKQLWWKQKHGTSILNPTINQPIQLSKSLEKQLHKQNLKQVMFNPFEISQIIRILHRKQWRVTNFKNDALTQLLNDVDNKTESHFEAYYAKNHPINYQVTFKNKKYQSAAIHLNSKGFITIEFMSVNRFKIIWNQVNYQLFNIENQFENHKESRFINYPIIINQNTVNIPDFNIALKYEQNPYQVAKTYIKNQLLNQLQPKPTYIYNYRLTHDETARYVILKNKF